jgi:hypothetical protein
LLSGEEILLTLLEDERPVHKRRDVLVEFLDPHQLTAHTNYGKYISAIQSSPDARYLQLQTPGQVIPQKNHLAVHQCSPQDQELVRELSC